MNAQLLTRSSTAGVGRSARLAAATDSARCPSWEASMSLAPAMMKGPDQINNATLEYRAPGPESGALPIPSALVTLGPMFRFPKAIPPPRCRGPSRDDVQYRQYRLDVTGRIGVARRAGSACRGCGPPRSLARREPGRARTIGPDGAHRTGRVRRGRTGAPGLLARPAGDGRAVRLHGDDLPDARLRDPGHRGRRGIPAPGGGAR